ncbi:AsmA-like C-terminal region-containing protein [Kordia algicida OT-1]|uniref:Outer membrane assembly protein n=1 Tax=Kordia algicida OT-1 TaxID=391587 RepID=A9DJV7_9FLAO|nr:AsmA-like C-terminal region-containing protein [Kordia algicida]EDP98196.1 outer membrane assembly protein [Kordia algicida OT-1]
MKVKKILKITGITLLVLIIALAVTPYLFKGKIIAMVKDNINKNVNAQVDFTDADVSFFRNFPKASIVLEDVEVINNAPFENDTLFYGKEVAITTAIGELFKGTDEAIQVYSFTIDNAKLNIQVDESGNANYDIAKPNTTETPENVSKTSDFKFKIDNYHILNTDINYFDAKSKTLLALKDVQHEGFGDFSLATSELDTQTDALVSFAIGDMNYIDKQHIKLDALIGMDLENGKYTFLENEALVNQLPLKFEGFVKVNPDSQEVDISLQTPSSDFKNFLAVIPEAYAKNISTVQTAGNFEVSGEIKGLVTETRIPTIDIKVVSNNASFKYPDLPKSVENININAQLKNTTGKTEDTYVDINNLAFKIDEDAFRGNGRLSQLTTNPKVNATIVGKLNLSNITKAYPIENKELSGILDANLTTNFDMNAIEKEQYQRIKNNGNLKISDFLFSSKDVVNPLAISEATIDFVPGKISLKKFDAKSGKSDFNATGTIENLLGFLFNEDKLKGNFKVNSNEFHVNDFMVASAEGSKNQNTKVTQGEALKIPEFLDCNINVNSNKVFYDNITLTNVKGSLALDDGEAILNNVTSDVFGGKIKMSGLVSTKNDTPTFAMDLGMDSFDLSESFNGLELLQTIAPIAKALNGKLNTNISLKGNLGENYTPNLTTISGNAFAELITTTLKTRNIDLFNKINEKLTFIDLNKVSIEDIKTRLSFDDGKVNVKPFSFNYKDIEITVDGSHGFDQSLNYNATFQIPAKYLGSEITALLSDIKSEEAKNITIPVSTKISGNFTSPSFTTDLASATKDLAIKLAKVKAQEALGNINTGSDTVDGILGGLIKGDKNETQKDSTVTTPNSTGDKVRSVLGNLLGNRKKKKEAEEKARQEAAAKAKAEEEAKKQQEKVQDSVN